MSGRSVVSVEEGRGQSKGGGFDVNPFFEAHLPLFFWVEAAVANDSHPIRLLPYLFQKQHRGGPTHTHTSSYH